MIFGILGVLEPMPHGFQGTAMYVKHLQQHLAQSKHDLGICY